MMDVINKKFCKKIEWKNINFFERFIFYMYVNCEFDNKKLY